MPKLSIILTAVLLLAIGTVSCNSKSAPPDEIADTSVLVIKRDEGIKEAVKYFTLQKQPFKEELLTNGKIFAFRKVNLKFLTDGVIGDIRVKEGAFVTKGQVLAVQRDQGAAQNLLKNQLSKNQAFLDYQDFLLRYGYTIQDTGKADPKMKQIARLRSGLSRSEIELQQAVAELAATRLSAPFAGRIGAMKAKVLMNSGGFEFICTLIDDRSFDVTFQVLEQELGILKQSSEISVSPFSEPAVTMTGKITSINPMVDDGGMITVHATIPQFKDDFLDGMSVKIKVKRLTEGQLVVPRSAVLDRQNKKVVFTLEDSVARWNYVEVNGENSTHFNIASGLKPGDKVIYEGNFNLADNKLVKVNNSR